MASIGRSYLFNIRSSLYSVHVEQSSTGPCAPIAHIIRAESDGELYVQPRNAMVYVYHVS